MRKSLLDDVDNKIIVVAATEGSESPTLKQFNLLRENIKNRAKTDYLEVQETVLNNFRTLMENLTTLSFYAHEAEKDTRMLEKAIKDMNAIKSRIAEDLLKVNEKEEKKVEAGVSDEPNEELEELVKKHSGKYFTNEDMFKRAAVQNGCVLQDSEDEDDVTYAVKDDDIYGEFNAKTRDGYLFTRLSHIRSAQEELEMRTAE